MGYLAAYNTSSFSGSLDRGNINIAISSSIASGSTGILRFGDSPTPPSGGMVIVSDSNVQLGIASASATPQFWIINNLADTASVLNTINALPERVNQTRFTTTSSAYLYLVSSSKYFPILGTEPLNTIVTDGLAMYLDAGQLVSYPTTASLWYDISGYNNNGSLVNGPTYNTNNYITFDGTDDRGDISSIVNIGNPNTVTAIVKLNGPQSGSSGAGSPGTSVYGPTANGADNWLGFSGSKINFFATELNDINNFELNSIASLDTSNTRWYSVTSTISGSIATIYLNGIQDNTVTKSFTIGGWNSSANIGSRGISQRLFKGSISSIQAYNKALTQAEITQNYYQGPIVTNGLVFYTDAGNLVSYESGSTTTYSLTGSVSGSLINGVNFNNENGGTWIFDGADDRIGMSSDSNLNFLGTSSYSIEVWGNLQSTGSGAKMMVSRENSIGVGRDGYNFIFTGMNSTTVSLSAERFASNVQTGISTQISTSQVLNKWCQFATTYDGQFYRLYFNGSLIATSTSITTNITNDVSQLSIGNRGTGLSNFINMKMSPISIYNRALSLAEIQQNYNARRQRFGI
jgi:hypothetical protein